jgi:ribosome-binding protein aMBF1 (putative translation factor)
MGHRAIFLRKSRLFYIYQLTKKSGRSIMPIMQDWENIMRQAIKDSGFSLYELERRAGVSAAQLSRFMAGKRSLLLSTAQKVGAAVDLKLKPKKRRGTNGKCI